MITRRKQVAKVGGWRYSVQLVLTDYGEVEGVIVGRQWPFKKRDDRVYKR